MPIHYLIFAQTYGNASRTATRAVVDEFEDVCEQTGVTLSRPLLPITPSDLGACLGAGAWGVYPPGIYSWNFISNLRPKQFYITSEPRT